MGGERERELKERGVMVEVGKKGRLRYGIGQIKPEEE